MFIYIVELIRMNIFLREIKVPSECNFVLNSNLCIHIFLLFDNKYP